MPTQGDILRDVVEFATQFDREVWVLCNDFHSKKDGFRLHFCTSPKQVYDFVEEILKAAELRDAQWKVSIFPYPNPKPTEFHRFVTGTDT